MLQEGSLFNMHFHATRSPLFARHGMVATSQPLASEIGLAILKQGGNAVDAAIAIAAALAVTEPHSTGLGGDCFLMYYDASQKRLQGINGSGRSSQRAELNQVLKDITTSTDVETPTTPRCIPQSHGHAVTVPGAVAGWLDAMHHWGSFTVQQVLDPAIQLATQGFPVSPITAHHWAKNVPLLQRAGSPWCNDLLLNGRAPQAGEVFQNPKLAQCLQEIACDGHQAFYQGRIAEKIVDSVASMGGVLSMEDLAGHLQQSHDGVIEPLGFAFEGIDVYEMPPNGQGITALLALGLLQQVVHNVGGMPEERADLMHLQIEALRLAFADTTWFVGDPDHTNVPVDQLLSAKYIRDRARLIDIKHAGIDPKRGSPARSCDTVSFQVVDSWGNAVSMVNSVYKSFGTGYVVHECGFPLQNRGCNFSLEPGHPNVLGPNKRPYHTILPAMSLFPEDQTLHATFTVMGGFMQPQGHVQVLCNLLLNHQDPQEALDAPRFCIDPFTDGQSVVLVEETLEEETVSALRMKGHRVQIVSGFDREVFGRGQVILRQKSNGVLCAGSDGRADGCAMGW